MSIRQFSTLKKFDLYYIRKNSRNIFFLKQKSDFICSDSINMKISAFSASSYESSINDSLTYTVWLDLFISSYILSNHCFIIFLLKSNHPQWILLELLWFFSPFLILKDSVNIETLYNWKATSVELLSAVIRSRTNWKKKKPPTSHLKYYGVKSINIPFLL